MEESRAVSSFLGIQELIRGEVQSVDEVIANISAVTQEDIKRSANRVIKSENLVLSIVGPFDDSDHFEAMLNLD
jgi:predicted Zn-dependent peptidase